MLLGISNDPAFEFREEDPRFQTVLKSIREKLQAPLDAIDRAIEDSGLSL